MQKETKIKEIEEVELNNPIVLEGLPGIGFVGKIVVDEIIKECNATKFAELTSDNFPPHVIMKEDGLIDYMKNEFYYIKEFGQKKQDIVLITGNSQGADFEGQIDLSKTIINYIEHLNAKQIYTLGGIGIGEILQKTSVCIAANNKDSIDEILKIDNTKIRDDEGGTIVGASGLLLYYAQEKDINAACLMGETPGFYIDPIPAKEMLLVLFELLDFEIDLTNINEQIELTQKRIEASQNFNNMALQQQMPKNDDLQYIG